MRNVSEGEDDRSAVSQTIADLRAEFERTELPRHLALFHRDPDTQLEVATEYVSQGLQTNQQCLYLADANTVGQIKTAFRSGNIDVAARMEADDLLIRQAENAYLDAGFDPDRMIASLEDACDRSQNEGYDGLRVAGENTWCFHTEVSFDHILDFEADFDSTCPGLPVTALCQYDLTQFNEESIAKAIWTHEKIIYRNMLCENPYYIPPAEYQARSEPYLNAQLMLEQTYDLARSHRQVDRREQRLAVVNRVLRHNIRNDMNVVRGNLDLVSTSEELGPENEKRLEAAIRQIEEMVETSDKARYIQETLGTETVRSTRLSPLLSRAVSQIEDKHPEATVDVSGDSDVTVLAESNLDVALTELLTNAIIHQSTNPPEVSVDISTTDVDVVQIGIGNPGEMVPERDRRALRQGRETQLEHASGLGLWFVKWVVENSRGVVEFPTGNAPQVRIKLQRDR